MRPEKFSVEHVAGVRRGIEKKDANEKERELKSVIYN